MDVLQQEGSLGSNSHTIPPSKHKLQSDAEIAEEPALASMAGSGGRPSPSRFSSSPTEADVDDDVSISRQLQGLKRRAAKRRS